MSEVRAAGPHRSPRRRRASRTKQWRRWPGNPSREDACEVRRVERGGTTGRLITGGTSALPTYRTFSLGGGTSSSAQGVEGRDAVLTPMVLRGFHAASMVRG